MKKLRIPTLSELALEDENRYQEDRRKEKVKEKDKDREIIKLKKENEKLHKELTELHDVYMNYRRKVKTTYTDLMDFNQHHKNINAINIIE